MLEDQIQAGGMSKPKQYAVRWAVGGADAVLVVHGGTLWMGLAFVSVVPW